MNFAGLRLPVDRPWQVLGLMSGTSADGIDAALIEVDPLGFKNGKPYRRFVAHVHAPYEPSLRASVLEAIQNQATPERICILQQELGKACANVCTSLKAHHPIDMVSLHGQTVQHHPQHQASLQLADPYLIIRAINTPVVWDLRRMDLAYGGQGAPLVPLAEQWLHGTTAPWIALNLGGIANVTVWNGHELLAWDTGPGMSLLDLAAHRWMDQTHDPQGSTASGAVHDAIIDSWMNDSYFHQDPPKSTGREYFGLAWFERALPALESLSLQDRLATLAAFTARTVHHEIKRVSLPQSSPVWVSGGGVQHHRLMKQLKSEASLSWNVDEQFPSGAREAVSWALLGAASACGIPGNLPSTTGASAAVVLGSWALGTQ